MFGNFYGDSFCPPRVYTSSENMKLVLNAGKFDRKWSPTFKIKPPYATENCKSLRKYHPVSSRSTAKPIYSLSYDRISTPTPSYYSLNDPHLKNYFFTKFGRFQTLVTAVCNPQQNYRALSSSSLSSSASSNYLQDVPNTIYKVAVTTGDLRDCGTDAKVYLTVKGTRAKIPKTWFIRSKFDKETNNNNKAFRFALGKTVTLKICHADIGDIKSILIENSGNKMKDSWFLECVTITNLSTKKSWYFICNQWLSLFHTDGQTQRVLFPQILTKTDYEIVIVTGNDSEAGTDANVFLTIFGKKGTHRKVQFSNEDQGFQRGSSRLFHVKANDIDPLRKIHIEHDGKGKSSHWFLERVLITNLKQPNIRYYFQCGRWLAKHKDDRKICRSLLAGPNPDFVRKETCYRVSVFTGNVKGAGTTAVVSLILFGENGNSSPLQLHNHRTIFERGSLEEFLVKSSHLGHLSHIRIGHDNTGFSPGWYLDKVIIDDVSQDIVYEFPCYQWLAKDKGAGVICRHLYLDSIPKEPVPDYPVSIRIATTDTRHAGTSSGVFLIIYGRDKRQTSSDKIWLNEGIFKRGETVIFNISVPRKLQPPVAKIEIGHDNSGISPDWHLEKVIIQDRLTGVEQVFPCNMWLATDEGDGLINRILHEESTLKKTLEKQQSWFVWVCTSERVRARTNAKVSIVVYGRKGKSEELLLNNGKNTFEAGQTDKFEIVTKDIGTPYKIRIWHDNSGATPGWHLHKIEMENSETGKHYEFQANCWLSKDEVEGGQIVRELPVSGPQVKDQLTVVQYVVTVYTGDVLGAGTDAKVFVNLFGKLGDTGKRYLENSKNNRNKFERGKVDEFIIEAVDLKEISKVCIGHDASRPGSGWFLDRVEISGNNNPSKVDLFPCNRWLAIDEDDGLTVRELTKGESQLLNTTTYEVHVKTGNIRGAGTDANVFLQILGSKNDTEEIPLKTPENSTDPFERGRIDIFKLELRNIGEIKKIKIGHDNSQLGAGWFLDTVLIKIPSQGKKYWFDCFRWLAVDEDDGQTQVILEASTLEQRDKVDPYEVTLWTGDVPNAGTNSNIHIKLYGDQGKSEECTLTNKSDNFKQGSVNTFKIEIPEIGELQKILVRCDNKGLFAGWFLHKILITRPRIVKTVSCGKTERQGTSNKHQPYSSDSQVEQYWFIVNQWFDKDANSSTKELVPTDQNGKPLQKYLQEIEYTVKVVTGDVFGAGTDANVFITVYGEYGDTSERSLAKSKNLNKFERNQEDIFVVKAIDMGRLRKVKIWHDNSGSNAAWFLDYVEVIDIKNQLTFFPCQRWLATNEGDGQVVRELIPVNVSLKKKLLKNNCEALKEEIGLEVKALTTTYHVKVFTADKWGAGTDANVYVILYGHLDNSGKILLKSSVCNSNKFERNQVDEFIIEVVDIGELQKIKIGHDDAGLGSAWCLDKVIIDCPSLGKSWNFPCDRWLAKNKDDGLLDKELYPKPVSTEYIPYIPYEVTTYTGDVSQASTDADVYIALYSKDKRTQQQSLCFSKAERKQKFKRNSVDKFILEMEDVGDDIERIRIGHDGSGFGAGWYLAKVQVRKLISSGKSSKTFVFPCNQWLAEDEDDGFTEKMLLAETSIIQASTTQSEQNNSEQTSGREQFLQKLPPKYKRYTQQEILDIKEESVAIRNKTSPATAAAAESQQKQAYHVIIITSRHEEAAICDDVWFTLKGSEQTTEVFEKINNSQGKYFQRGQTDGFTISCFPVGEIKSCCVGAVWRHDKTSSSSSSSSSSSLNDTNSQRWLCEQVTVIDEVTGKIYYFWCNDWVKVEKKISQNNSVKLLLLDTTQHKTSGKKVETGEVVNYVVLVFTADVKHAGTDANVFINIFGENGETGRQPLKQRFRDLFERNQKDTFTIECIDLGRLRGIFIEHDSSGFGSAWLLDRVEIINNTTQHRYIFPCNSWLDKKTGTTSMYLQPQH